MQVVLSEKGIQIDMLWFLHSQRHRLDYGLRRSDGFEFIVKTLMISVRLYKIFRQCELDLWRGIFFLTKD